VSGADTAESAAQDDTEDSAYDGGEATQAGLPTADPFDGPPPTSGSSQPRPFGAGMGGGPVPPYWGPDAATDTGSFPAVEPRSPGSRWLRLAAVVGVLALLGLATAVGFYLGRSDGEAPEAAPDDSSPSATPEPIELAAVSAFDPDGDGPITDENPEDVPLAHDGDPSTAWGTSTYFDGPALAPFKSGVGLLLDLGEEVDVSGAEVTFVGGPYDVELRAAPEGGSAPTSVNGMATLATASGAAAGTELAADDPVRTRYLVVWLTALPGTSEGFRGSVAEVSVSS
jgi:putative peptidoglycan lipid II flippase